MPLIDTKKLDWFKPAIYGAIVGAGVLAIIGFSWGGWKTGASVEKYAENHAESEVTKALLPICLENSRSDPQSLTTLAKLKEASNYKRSEIVMNSGWATMPGTEGPNRRVANACVDELAMNF